MADQAADSRAEKAESARAAKSEATAAQQKTAEKSANPSPRSDRVELSTALTGASQTQQEMQAKRVESIKARIQAGTYEVSSRDVAEKMLSGSLDL